jgi:STE24 endopeptidase
MTSASDAAPTSDRPPPADAARARRYERTSLLLRLLNAAFAVAALVIFLVSGASVALRDLAERVSDAAVVQVAVFGLVVIAGWSALTLPISYLTGFRREHRWGLSRQPLRSWLADQAKSFLLGLVFSLLLLEAVYLLLRLAGGWWWAWAALGMLAVNAVMTALYPAVIMPLFWKLEPITDAALTARLTEIARRQGVRVRGVYRMAMSAKTRRANAMVAGLGRTQRIILGDTLLDGFTEDEVTVVVAHEVAHQAHGDLWKGLLVSGVIAAVGLWVAARVLEAVASIPPLRGPADLAALPVLLLSLAVFGLITLPLTNAYSRRREAAADRAALDATGLADALAGAMRRLAALNLANPAPHPLVEAIFYSHPAITRRIAMAEAWRAGAA